MGDRSIPLPNRDHTVDFTRKGAEATAPRPLRKDDELQIVWGEVYAPGFPDSQGHFMVEESIRDMSYGFMKKSDMFSLDTSHDQSKNGCYIVESFIARDEDDVFIPGSWVIGVKVPDPVLWAGIKSGEINGFSIDGVGRLDETVIEVNMPDTVTGETDDFGGERHKFYVKFDDEGEFLGGFTEPGTDGHYHAIIRGTITEEANGHTHRFSFVEGILEAQGA